MHRLLIIALLLTLGCSHPEPVPPPPSASELFTSATEAMKANKPREAIELFTQIIELQEFNEAALPNRAACYGEIEDYERMVADTRYAVLLDKTNITALELLAAYYLKTQEHELARAYAVFLLEADPGNKVGSRVLGVARE